MKVPMTLKDPDTMPDAVEEAVKRLEKPDGVSDEEWADIRESRAEMARDAIAEAFMDYSEYLRVVFDVADDGTVTATVVRRKDSPL